MKFKPQIVPSVSSSHLTDTLTIVTNPTQFANQPALRTFAWATLKSERGQKVNEDRLSDMQRDLQARTLRRDISHHILAKCRANGFLPTGGSAFHRDRLHRLQRGAR